MTRRLLAFFVPSMLAAQQTIVSPRCANLDLNHPTPPECYPIPQCDENGMRCAPHIPRPKNGECPVCGTMAQPYHEGSSSTQDAYYPWPGSRRLTICEHCNATFRQWAEGKEPKR